MHLSEVCFAAYSRRIFLTGPLEPTNRPYALAKIAGVEMCWSYNRQYGTHFLAVMPTNLYGPGDNYHPDNSHVIPALVRKFHQAKMTNAGSVVVWGSGTPRREFLFCDDLADACVFIMSLPAEQFENLLGSDDAKTGRFEPPLLNIGAGKDLTVLELAMQIRDTVGFKGEVVLDPTKPDGTPRKLLDSSRLENAGWRPHTSLAEGLRKSYEDFQKLVTPA